MAHFSCCNVAVCTACYIEWGHEQGRCVLCAQPHKRLFAAIDLTADVEDASELPGMETDEDATDDVHAALEADDSDLEAEAPVAVAVLPAMALPMAH